MLPLWGGHGPHPCQGPRGLGSAPPPVRTLRRSPSSGCPLPRTILWLNSSGPSLPAGGHLPTGPGHPAPGGCVTCDLQAGLAPQQPPLQPAPSIPHQPALGRSQTGQWSVPSARDVVGQMCPAHTANHGVMYMSPQPLPSGTRREGLPSGQLGGGSEGKWQPQTRTGGIGEWGLNWPQAVLSEGP